MKRYPNTKKFLLLFFIVLLILFIAVLVWRSLKRSAGMRPAERRQSEQQDVPPVAADRRPGKDSEAEPAATEYLEESVVSLEELAENPHFGWPASPFLVLEIVEYKAFTLAYHEQHEQAAWVAYRLHAQGKKPRVDRHDRFIADQNIMTQSASPEDYANSGYDRGHLAPAADFALDKEAMRESFYMSNMSPQDPSFNRGIWSKLENRVRDWADENEEVWVVTGPILHDQKRLKKIGENKVSIPRYYYKVVLDVRPPAIKMIGFSLRNEGSSKALQQFIISVDSLEGLTGLDFFPLLPDELEDSLESGRTHDGWTNLD